MPALLCAALLAGLAAGARAQTDACAGTEGAGRLTPDNEQWPNRDRIAALKTTHPELWRKVCRDLPMPNPDNGNEPTLVSNLASERRIYPSYTSYQYDFTSDHRQLFTTGPNPSGYVLESVDIQLANLSDPAIFSKLTVTVDGQTLRPPAFVATTEPRAYRFEAPSTGVSLLPSTTYHVTLDVTASIPANTSQVVLTTSDTVSGEPGWIVGTTNTRRNKRWDRGSFGLPFSNALKLRINGEARPAGAPLVRIDVADTNEGSSMVVTATLPASAPRALSFWVDMRECDWSPPTTRPERLYGHDAVAACQAKAPGDGFAREADFNMWHLDGSARAFIHIAAGQTSGTLDLPAISGDGSEGSEAIAFTVMPFGQATRAYLKYSKDWYHPNTRPDGYSGNRHPLWVGRIHASTGGTPIGGSLVPDGAQVGQGRTQSAPAIDPALVAAVRDLAGQTHHGTAHVNRWRQVLIAFGVETYDGLTATTAAEAQQNAQRFSSPLWPQIATVLTALETPDPPDTLHDPPQQDTPQDGGTQDGGTQDGTPQDPPQDGGTQDGTQDGTPQDGGTQDGTPQDGGTQDGTPQDGGTQDGTPQDPPQQDPPQDGGTQDGGTADPPQDPPQQGYTVDTSVVAKVKALAAQTHHGPVHVNRWNRVLVAFGEHDGTGVTDGPMTLDEAQENTKRHSSPVWNEVVAELTKLKAAQ